MSVLSQREIFMVTEGADLFNIKEAESNQYHED